MILRISINFKFRYLNIIWYWNVKILNNVVIIISFSVVYILYFVLDISLKNMDTSVKFE
jgi:hypothetical protein